MKKLFKNLANSARTAVQTLRRKASDAIVRTSLLLGRPKAILASRSGEAYLDLVIKILLCVVLGALLLAGLYALFGDLVMPTLTKKIQEMFNYAG